ncbi:MAG: hemolysin family protein [Bythopirellula sp.]|nr:hemolysin family protein [Bythopirellula sp.]
MWGLEIAVMLAMIGINCIFAGYEIALASITVARLQRLSTDKRAGAKVALYMKENMEASLAVVQLGITLVGAIAAAVGGAGAQENLAPTIRNMFGVKHGTADFIAIAGVVLPLTVVTIIFGELIPKVFAIRNAEWVCLRLSPFMRWFAFSVWPAVWLFETIVMGVMSWGESFRKAGSAKPETAELHEIRATAAIARASRLIGHREEGIIHGATEMQSRPVRDIMLPAEHIRMLDINASLGDNLITAHLDMHTRFPVVEKMGDLQTVVGYVNVKDIIATLRLSPQDASLRAIVRRLPSFRDTQPIAECLERLMREHTHIAIVRDASEKVIGMVSLEDILEELVGEIEDEYDRLPAHIVSSGNAWVVGGGVPLERLKAAADLNLMTDLPEHGAHTLSEWVIGHLGHEVTGGEIIERGPWRVVVRKVRRKKVQEAQVSQAAN